MGDTKLNRIDEVRFSGDPGGDIQERPMKSCGVSLDILAVFIIL